MSLAKAAAIFLGALGCGLLSSCDGANAGSNGTSAGSDRGGWASSEEVFRNRWNREVSPASHIDHFDHPPRVTPSAMVGGVGKVEVSIEYVNFTMYTLTPKGDECGALVQAGSGLSKAEADSLLTEAVQDYSRTGQIFAQRSGVSLLIQRFSDGTWGCTVMKSKA